MGIRAFVALAATGAVVSGCYVDSLQDRPPGGPGSQIEVPKASAELGDAGTCRFVVGKGCFDGYLAPKQQFYIDGKQFFNGDDLATRFHELINVSGPAGKPLTAEGGGYQLTLATALDNESFAQGFDYQLTGAMPRSGKLRADGSFSVDDLQDGTYDLRVSRSVKFQLTAKAPAPSKDQPMPPASATAPVPATPAAPTSPSVPGQTPDTGTVTKNYCATLYVDTTEVVRRSTRIFDNFADFKLYITDNECAPSGSSTTLSLKP